jgi:hypothetical protein
MLKLLRIRSWIGLMAVSVVAAGIFAMQDRVSTWWATGRFWMASGQEERDWRQNELMFLKEIYDRLERQRQAEGGDTPASLRREQQAILQRMAQAAKPIRDKIPPEIRALLPDPPAPEAEKPVTLAMPAVAPAAPIAPPAAATSTPPAGPSAAPLAATAPPPVAPAAAPTPPPAQVELRIGTASLPPIDVDLGRLSRDLGLDRPAERIQKLREPRPAKAPEAKSADAKSAEAKSAEAKAGEAKPTEAKRGEAKSAGANAGEAKPDKPKPAKPKPAAASPEVAASPKE